VASLAERYGARELEIGFDQRIERPLTGICVSTGGPPASRGGKAAVPTCPAGIAIAQQRPKQLKDKASARSSPVRPA
jgi:chemotaxis response regulator CheB